MTAFNLLSSACCAALFASPIFFKINTVPPINAAEAKAIIPAGPVNIEIINGDIAEIIDGNAAVRADKSAVFMTSS